MTLKSAALCALIGVTVSGCHWILQALQVISYSVPRAIFVQIVYYGALIVFFGTLYRRAAKA